MRAASSALLAAVLLAGCAATGPRIMRLDPASGPERKLVVWPRPPETPRFSWAGQLLGDANFQSPEGGGKDFLSWLAGVIIGERRHAVRVQRPQAGAIDAAGRIYVADTGNSAVFVFDTAAGELQVWDRAEGGARFVSPVGVAVGPGGDLLVADSRLGVIARLDPKGNARRAIGRGVLERPSGVAYDPRARRIYVADSGAHAIKVFDDGGRFLKSVGRRGGAPGEFNFPTHLAFARGELYVTDTLNSRVQVLAGEDLAPRLQLGTRGVNVGNLVRPKGVGVDSEGNIYVVESYYDHLLVFDRNGELLLAIGGSGSGMGQFDLPSGVWVDHANRVFVADMYNSRVAVFQFLGSGK